MSSKMKKYFLYPAALIIALGLGEGSMVSGSQGTPSASERQPYGSLEYQVYTSLLKLPYYGVFDALGVSVEGSTVTLTGYVQRAALKSEAEWAVEKITGVREVINNIEILPPSPMDDDIRLRAYSAIYSSPGFDKYLNQPVRPIKIIVKNGSITLIGTVDSDQDRTVAEIVLKSIPFVHSITNQLTVR